MREAEKNAVALLIVGAIVGLVSISPIVGADGAEIYYIILRVCETARDCKHRTESICPMDKC